MVKPSNIIFLKNLETQKVFHNKKRYSQPIASYLTTNNFSNETSIQFPIARVTGPILLTINDTPFHLFLGVRAKDPNFSTIISQLPFWLKLLIPLLISISISWLLARRLTKPIIAIKHAAKEIGNGHYDTRVVEAVTRNDELGELSVNFNQMANKLETNIHAQQRLLADVSHETSITHDTITNSIGAYRSFVC